MNNDIKVSFDLDLMFDLYTIEGHFIEKAQHVPVNFTGLADWLGVKKYWYLNGKLHRLGNPAIECANGDKLWFIDGQETTKEQHDLLYDLMKLKILA